MTTRNSNYIINEEYNQEKVLNQVKKIMKKPVKNSYEHVITTSNKNLIPNLTYIISLAGHYSSICLNSKKVTVVEHHTRLSNSNHESYCLRINHSKYTSLGKCDADIIPYLGDVYCIELPKHHTLWIKKGKTFRNENHIYYTRFFKKEKTYTTFKELPSNEFKSLADLERLASLKRWKVLKDRDIPDNIPKPLKDNMISFEKQSEKFDDGNEWAQVCNLTTGEIYTIMSDGEKYTVSPFKDKDYGTDEMAMVHNHQDGTFLSPKDFYSGFYNNNNIKYIVVHTDNYIFIAKLINIPTKSEFKQFVSEYNNIRASSSPDKCWNMFNSNSITCKYVSVDMVVKL